jgi:hypothetical protein
MVILGLCIVLSHRSSWIMHNCTIQFFLDYVKLHYVDLFGLCVVLPYGSPWIMHNYATWFISDYAWLLYVILPGIIQKTKDHLQT